MNSSESVSTMWIVKDLRMLSAYIVTTFVFALITVLLFVGSFAASLQRHRATTDPDPNSAARSGVRAGHA